MTLVRQTVPLGAQWPTIDPFLFCAHHDDRYPAGTDRFAPRASLDGRDLGADFAGVDGWNMYHGLEVPGFPAHPHRGFETVTYVRRGVIDHSDSLGAAARFGEGDTQWVTAGRGIVHSEMFPLLQPDAPNPLELFQIWLNLPAASKLVDPYFTMLWADSLPVVHLGDATITVIAGALGDAQPPSPPPDSYASRAGSDVAIWHVRLPAGGACTLPPAASAETVRTLYCFRGDGVQIGETNVDGSTGALVEAELVCPLRAYSTSAVELLVLQGKPIGEPVARYGPFVMNTEAEIRQAFTDYERDQFGGWPWPDDAPVHGGRDRTHFAEVPPLRH